MKRTKRLVLSSLFCALCCIGTMIRIPTGLANGYVHLGDAFVLLSGIILGPLAGGIAAAIGSSLADLNGYAIWIPGTFIIKGLSAVIVSLFFRRFKKTNKTVAKKNLYLTLLTGGILAELIMIAGYFFYEILIIILGNGSSNSIHSAVSAAALGIPFNIMQGVFGIAISVLLIPVLLRIEDMRNLIYE